MVYITATGIDRTGIRVSRIVCTTSYALHASVGGSATRLASGEKAVPQLNNLGGYSFESLPETEKMLR